MNDKNDGITGGELFVNGVYRPGGLCIKTLAYTNNSNYILNNVHSNIYIYENPSAMPRAFISHNVTSSSNDTEILDMLKNPGFSWAYSVILSGQNISLQNPVSHDLNDYVDIELYKPAEVQINTSSEQPGYLVLTDAYYPGWNAYVNGNKVDIYRANYAFRAIKLNPGQNIVEFKYEPMSVSIGAIISFLSFLTLSLILLISKYRYKKS